MNIDQLRCLVAVVDLGSFRAAADALGLSQPAVSRSVGRLQSDVPDRLLEPSGRGVRTTIAGIRFAASAREVLARFDELRSGVSPRATFRIAGHEPFSTPLLPTILAEGTYSFADGEDATISIIDAGPAQIDVMVAGGEVDVGVTTHPGASEGAATVMVGELRCRAYANAHLRESPRRSLGWVVPTTFRGGVAHGAPSLDGWPPEAPRRVDYEVTMLASALELCSSGAAAAWLPDAVVAHHERGSVAERRLGPLHGDGIPEPRSLPVFLRYGRHAPDDVRLVELRSRLAGALRVPD